MRHPTDKDEKFNSHACTCTSLCSPAPGVVVETKQAPEGIPVFRIPSMDCASEEGEIRHSLAQVPGFRSLSFQLGARTLAIDAPADAIPAALAAIRKAGFKPVPVSENTESEACDKAPGTRSPALPEGMPRYALALTLALCAEALAFFTPGVALWSGLGMLLAVAAIGLAGFSTYAKGLAALRNRRPNINALMTVAVTGAFLIGQWLEATMVMVLYAIAEFIQARSVDRARNAVKGLLDMTPEMAEVRQADCTWSQKSAKTVALDAVIRVKPGARVPSEGIVITGSTTID